MINVIQAWMLQDAIAEKEVHEAREKVKVDILRSFNGEDLTAYMQSGPVGIVYDEDGAPRPAPMAYDGAYSDGHPSRSTAVRPLPPETVPTDDYANPFPGLDPPVG